MQKRILQDNKNLLEPYSIILTLKPWYFCSSFSRFKIIIFKPNSSLKILLDHNKSNQALDWLNVYLLILL